MYRSGRELLRAPSPVSARVSMSARNALRRTARSFGLQSTKTSASPVPKMTAIKAAARAHKARFSAIASLGSSATVDVVDMPVAATRRLLVTLICVHRLTRLSVIDLVSEELVQ